MLLKDTFKRFSVETLPNTKSACAFMVHPENMSLSLIQRFILIRFPLATEKLKRALISN